MRGAKTIVAGWMGIISACAVVPALAETRQAFAIHEAMLYSQPIQFSEEDKQVYASQGKSCLRNYIRSQIRQVANQYGVVLGEESYRPGVVMDLSKLYSPGGWLPQKTRARLYADERLEAYAHCGRFLPMEAEVDSAWQLTPRMQINAQLDAPFNNWAQLCLGSEWEWKQGLHSSLKYKVSAKPGLYDGMDVGVSYVWNDWRLEAQYNLSPEFLPWQHIRLTCEF